MLEDSVSVIDTILGPMILHPWWSTIIIRLRTHSLKCNSIVWNSGNSFLREIAWTAAHAQPRRLVHNAKLHKDTMCIAALKEGGLGLKLVYRVV